MNIRYVLGASLLSLVSLNAFAARPTTAQVIDMTVKSVQEAIVKNTVIPAGCHEEDYLDGAKFTQQLAGGSTAFLINEGGGGSPEGDGSESLQYAGAIVTAAPEAYSSSPNKFAGQPVNMVLGLKLTIRRDNCTKKSATGELTVYRDKSNGKSVTVKFPIN